MDINLLVTILTSSNVFLAKRAYDSIDFQQDPPLGMKVTIYIVVNSLNKKYIFDIVEEFKYIDNVHIIETESNGTPGKGHNSCIDLFRSKPEFSHLTILDGDDALYPCAFNIYYNYITETNLDILHLACNDKIRITVKPSTVKWRLKHNFQMTGNFKLSYNLWEENKGALKNPFKMNILESSTPSRVLLLSRNIFNCSFPICHSNTLNIFDDMIMFLNILEAVETN